jgi:hypothetical protein
MSLVESCANVAIGYIVAVLAQVLVFPFFHIHVAFSDQLLIGVIFTVISLLRSYFIRRFFNWIHS